MAVLTAILVLAAILRLWRLETNGFGNEYYAAGVRSMLQGLHLSAVVSFLIQVVCVTFLLVLFGEVLPKVYATQNNLRMALFSAPFLDRKSVV